MPRKLNILQFICPAGFYGAERWILALAKNLDRKQVQCHLAVTRESATQNIEIYRRYQELGLPAFKIAMRGRFDPLGLKRLVALIREQHIDIIHTHGYKSDILGWLAARAAGIRCLATPHGFENSRDLKLQLFIRLGTRVLRHFDCVAPLSEDLQRDLLRLKIRSEKIHMIQNGVDLTEIDAIRNGHRARASHNGQVRKIIYVGQLSHRKNLKHLLAAFSRLYRHNRQIRLLLLGDGPQKKELQAYTTELGCSEAIEFLGYREDRLELMQDCDLFCMTSSLEGIPRAMMEAMALGVPVTAYDIPGVDNLILNHNTGLLADFNNIELLAENCHSLLFDEKLATRVASSARKHISQNFSAHKMAEEYTQLYNAMQEHPK